MYEFIQDLIGILPSEFSFIYAILTLVFATLTLSFLFQLFYIPIKLLKE